MSEAVAEKVVSIEEALSYSFELVRNKEYAQAIDICNKILQVVPGHLDAKYVSGICYMELGNFDLAEKTLLECFQEKPNSEELNFNLGGLYDKKGDVVSSIEYYKKVIKINPRHIGAANNLANIYNAVGKNEIALELLKNLLNNGVNEYFIHNNIAMIYKKVGLLEEALSSIQKAINLNPIGADQYQNAANILASMGRSGDAIKCYELALQYSPNNLQILSEYMDAAQRVCDWAKHDILLESLENIYSSSISDYVEGPMSDIQRRIDPEHNLKVARKFTNHCVKDTLKVNERFSFDKKRKNKNKKIRIGYVSSDITDHPVGHLMRGVFKNHDKKNFEIYLYSSSKPDHLGYKKSIESYCDKVIDISMTSNQDLANKIYGDEIDVLVDLNGHTGQSRLSALSLKPAPVQISYIGYIGSMGADFIDYIITDEVVTPKDQQKFYTEKFIYMPDCYQANDNELEISNETVTKAQYGLPEGKFIFCSFNQTYKIEPVMFDVWMNILKRVPNSVLWLYKGSIYQNDNLAIINLSKEAEARGVEASRLVFAEPELISKHLKRVSLADIALDTRIYNGGTMTSQTLWAGAPVITLQGGHFASRMASSILNALEMPELITRTLKEYEDLAIDLANNHEKVKTLKEKLSKKKKTAPLFNTVKFTRNIENAYKSAWENYVDNEKPQFIDLNNK